MVDNSSHTKKQNKTKKKTNKQTKKEILIFYQKHTLNNWIRSIFLSSTCIFAPNVGKMNFILIWQAPIVIFQKWYVPLLSIVTIKLQVRRVLRLTKMHDYFNVPPCLICTPCIIWFRHSTSGIFGLWAFRKYIILYVSNVYNKEYAPFKTK